MTRAGLTDFLNDVAPGYRDLTTVSGDASFRKYYRIYQQNTPYIVMDAPPQNENAELFSQVSLAFAQAGINVPEVIEADFDNGFLLLSDLGDTQLISLLKSEQQSEMLDAALNVLFKLQQQGGQHILELPHYSNEKLLSEMQLFDTWFVKELLGVELDLDTQKQLLKLYQMLINSANKQEKTWVHRDYHSRNLMFCQNQIGVIDYQDAVYGPITYDLASLLKDCYIRYERPLVEKLVSDYHQRLVEAEMISTDLETFMQDFEWMALQRHIKVLGIFSRLSIRDNKPGYLGDLPLVFAYTEEAINRYPSFIFMRELFAKLKPLLAEKLAELGVKAS